MDYLPYEIIEEIVKNLPSYDLINFCKSYEYFFDLLRNKNVVINFDLNGCFDIYKELLYKNIREDIGYEFIKYLNLNKLYWLELDEIRSIIKLLPILEELRALDTILGMRDDDIPLYKKLKKLAISVEADQFTSTRESYRENFLQLKSLCIKFVSKYRGDFRRIYYMFFNELRKIDELWIYDADDMESNQILRYDYIVCNLRNLKKLVIKSKLNLTLLDYKPFGLLKVFERRRNNITTIYYVKFDNSQLISSKKISVSENRTEKSWNIVQSFLTEIPCNYKTALKLNELTTIKNIDFNELTFFHSRLCNVKFINSVVDILLSKRCRSLTKLSLTYCILQGNKEIRLINSLIYRKFNILEGNIEQLEKENVFKHIINNCRYLAELEILPCSSINNENLSEDEVYLKTPCYSSAIIKSCNLIDNLKYLRKLSLIIPQYLNGSFLKDVFLKCPELQSLKLISEKANEDLNSVLYSHLNYAQNIKDFRYENVHIDLDRLFSAFNKVINSKLQRIVVKCDYEHSTHLWPLEKLLKRNSSILFIAILVSKYNRHQINKLQELLNRFANHSAKIYIAKSILTPEDDIIIPEAHKDILYFNSDVAVINLTDY